MLDIRHQHTMTPHGAQSVFFNEMSCTEYLRFLSPTLQHSNQQLLTAQNRRHSESSRSVPDA